MITIPVTNRDKILFPEDGITKGDLINYYLEIAPFMLPYLKDHPLTMERFPNGIDGKSFFQKDAYPYFPKWIKTLDVPKKEGGYIHYIVCQNIETLHYISNLACIAIHLWLSSINNWYYPDKLIFDIDPYSIEQFSLVKKIAISLQEILKSIGLKPFVMTTGSRGLHVVIPIDSSQPYKAVQYFAKGCSLLLKKKHNREITLEFQKDKRENKIFIDIYRNQFSATAVCPFSVRPKPKAPVATPIAWEELNDKTITSQSYNIKNIFTRLNQLNDPWHDFSEKQSILKATKKLIALLE